MSEIDDIFSSKNKSKEIDPATQAKKKKKAKNHKRKREPESLHDSESPTKPRPIPETVIDPSASSASFPSTKRPRTEKSTDGVKLNASTKDTFDENNFADSRGLSQRLYLSLLTSSCSRFSITGRGPITKTTSLSGKKTEEGWNIYKEEELKLGTGGGEQVQYRAFLPFLLIRFRHGVVSI